MKKRWIVEVAATSLLVAGIAGILGCASITPDELTEFKVKAAKVENMSQKCAAEPAANCCAGLAEASRALRTVITAIED
jgi:hypothetical protein